MYNSSNMENNNENINNEYINSNSSSSDIKKELDLYLQKHSFLRNEVLRLEGVIMYLQNLLQQKDAKPQN